MIIKVVFKNIFKLHKRVWNINEEGPAHDKRFTVDVIIDNIVYGEGIGTSKKEAEQEAAKKALDKMAVK